MTLLLAGWTRRFDLSYLYLFGGYAAPMKLTILTFVVGVTVLGLIFELLRRRQLREKYAVLWLAIAVSIVPLAAFPRLLDSVAGLVGVVSGVSLVLFLGLVLVLLICLHLSWESSRLEEETRTLAEEVALLRIRQEALETSYGAVANCAVASEGVVGADR
jgi:hypothetical protein